MKKIFTVQELSEYLTMNPRTLQRKASKGEIPTIKLGRQYRFDKEKIDRWLTHKEVAKPLQILVVDDDPAVGRLFTQSLEALGHSVTLSAKSIEAFDFITRKLFDLVFVNLLMPGIDGSELFARIRDTDKNVTIVIMTGEIDTDRLKRAMKKGPVLLMHKPLDGDDVVEALNNFVRRQEVNS